MNTTAALRRRALLASAAALVMQGCASVGAPEMGAQNIRPAANAPPSSISDSDAYYGSAVAAIDQRDYARALDLLQAARARAPGDVRILNAFGVVYDKLGRFDLSQRYYAQAQAAEPTSAIVAQNLAYSRALQGDAAAVTLAEVGDPLSHTTDPQIERAAPSRTQALLHAPPAVAIAQAAPARAAVANAPVSPPRPQPVVIVSPASVATTSEPFVVRLTSVFRDEIVAPRAVRVTLPQPAAAPAPAKLASAPSASQPGPRLALASHAVAVRPASTAPAPARLASAPAASQPEPRLALASHAMAVRPASAAPAPARPARAPAASRAEPRLTLASNAAAVRPAASSTQVPARPQAAAAPRNTSVAVATRVQTPPRVRPITPAAPVVSSGAITKAAVRTPPRATAAASAKSLVPAQPPRARTLLGRPVMVVYSNMGRRDAERLRAQLGRRGWTLAVASRRTPPPRMTVVRYDAGSQRVALALVRSLRIPVKLERCRAQCSGVSIILGGRSALRMATSGDHGRTLG